MQRLDASAIEGMAVELPQRIERSIYETREEFDQRISEVIRSIRDQQAAIDRRVDTLPHVQWIRPTYFEWVALHQIRRMTHEEIGKQYHVAWETVRNRVFELKKLIRLNLPRGPHK